MNGITVDKQAYVCVHWKQFPPPFATSGKTPEELREEGRIDQNQCSRMKVWQKVCNKCSMDEGCLQCPLVRLVTREHTGTYLQTVDGQLRVRVSK